MKKTYAYTRYMKPKALNKSGCYLAGHAPLFLGVTLNRDDPNRDYLQAEVEYDEARFHVREAGGRRDLVETATGASVFLTEMLAAGAILVREFRPNGPPKEGRRLEDFE